MKLRAGGCVGLFALVAGFAQAQFLYVGNSGDGTISRVDLAGNVSTFATGFANIYGLAGDSSGNLYVSSTTAHKVVRITPAGTITDYATDFPSNSSLMGMAFDSSGNLFVADVSAGIYKITPSGTVSLWATGMSYPRDVAFNDAGVLYAVGGYNPMTMYSIASNGTPTLFASQAANAGFTCIDFGYLDWAHVGGSNSTFYQINTSAAVLSYLGQNVTDVVYTGTYASNEAWYFLVGGSLFRDVNGNINTFATGFSTPTALAFVAVPEPATTAALIGLLALLAVGVRRRFAE
ncbi:MAG: hypothetical protein C0518_11100 [Opitutus sp.]|nr:hypothetical protein [Opitutus sp.]